MYQEVIAANLICGDMVDLENDPYVTSNPMLASTLLTVAAVDRETDTCVAVWFEGFDCVGFPPDHVLKVWKD